MWWMHNKKKWKMSYNSRYPCLTTQPLKVASELMGYGLNEVV